MQLVEAVLVVLAMNVVACTSAQPRATAQRLLAADWQRGDREEVSQYLFPALTFGPNNEKRDLRHILAFAKQLDMGVMATGIFKHYLDNGDKVEMKPAATQSRRQQQELGSGSSSSEGLAVSNSSKPRSELPACFPPGYAGFMPFEQVLDRSVINAWVPTATVQELRERGWDGKLDAVLYGTESAKSQQHLKKYVDKALMGTGVVLPAGAPLLTVRHGPMRCSERLFKKLKEQLSPYRYIGVVGIVPGYVEKAQLSSEPSKPPEDACNRTIFEADRLLQPAAWIRALAHKYAEQSWTGSKYIAVHVRPYPDSCMLAWSGQYGLDLAAIKQYCHPQHQDLHARVGPCVAALQRKLNIKTVFVLSHPDIRANVHMLLDKAGVAREKYLDGHRVTSLSGCEDSSTTFLLMVEEAIAAGAAAFLGTHVSSITHSIVYERLSMDPAARNSFLEECVL